MKTNSKNTLLKKSLDPVLTHDAIAALLEAYYGAVALDQVRANELLRNGFPPRKHEPFSDEENRERRLGHVELLLDTLSLVSPEILAKLTVIAATRKPTAVRKVLRRMLSEGTTAYLVGERMCSSPEFFNALAKEADQAARASKDSDDPSARMMRWLDPADPLRIARECGYKKSMSSQIWR